MTGEEKQIVAAVLSVLRARKPIPARPKLRRRVCMYAKHVTCVRCTSR